MDNKAEAILDQALGEFNDGLGGAKSKSSGKKKKGSKKKAEPAGLGGLGLPSKTEKAPPQPKGMGSLGLPAKEKVGAKEGGKGKKKKGGSGAQPAFNPFDPFGAMAGAGGMGGNPYAQMGGGGFGANPYAQADPFADLMRRGQPVGGQPRRRQRTRPADAEDVCRFSQAFARGGSGRAEEDAGGHRVAVRRG